MNSTGAARSRSELLKRIQNCRPEDFPALALSVFAYQAAHNPIYSKYLELLRLDPAWVTEADAIPFLPIEFFKRFELRSGDWKPAITFSSSGTTGAQTSRHLLRHPDFYRTNARRGFTVFYGPPEGYCFLALLPSYLERSGSSLIFMVEDFIRLSRYRFSGFFLNNTDELVKILRKCKKEGIPTVLLGVSFALLDLAETHSLDLSGIIVMETGGMKGRRQEVTREELHRQLQQAFHLEAVHSEYCMTELLSQAYSKGGGLFFPAPTLRVRTREITDPLCPQRPGRTGAINIIDLANLDTISFIATDDLGRYYEDGSFEILGRLDASDMRGCNLLVL